MNQARTLARLLLAAGAAIMALALVVPAAGAVETPAEGYGYFSACPPPEKNAEISTCLRSDITGGHFQMGSKDVPITKTITLSGGINGGGENFEGELTGDPQPVPGGVIGLTGLDWLVNFLNVEQLKLYADTELAGTPQVILDPMELPIKVHLINAVLGSSCYVGSNKEPIELRLTTATTSPPPPNEPITGKNPEITFDEETEIIHDEDGEFVDNAFAAPGVNGCKLTLLGFIPISLNPVINLASGLPSPAGTNETRQEFDLSLVSRERVYP